MKRIGEELDSVTIPIDYISLPKTFDVLYVPKFEAPPFSDLKRS